MKFIIGRKVGDRLNCTDVIHYSRVLEMGDFAIECWGWADSLEAALNKAVPEYSLFKLEEIPLNFEEYTTTEEVVRKHFKVTISE